MSLYGDALSPVDTFTYLGVPFDGQGISASSLIAHRTASTLSSMRLLHSMGLNRQGFTLLLSSRLYATFVRPKLEYGLAIIRLLKKDVAELERTQDRCLRMIVSGHSKASTVVLRHITNLPSMMFRADTLVLKYCLRFDRLPHDSLLPLLSSTVQSPSIDRLRQRQIVQDCPADISSTSQLSRWLYQYRQAQFTSFLSTTQQKLIKACRPVLRVDPILFLPSSHADRSRLVRWRMGWIPGKPVPCSCNLGLTTRSHLMICSSISSALWSCLPFPPPDFTGHHIDFVINMLPTSTTAPCPSYWPALCEILLEFDKLCHPDTDYSSFSPPGQLWLEKTSAAKFS